MRPHALVAVVVTVLAAGAVGTATMGMSEEHGTGPVGFLGAEEVETSFIRTREDQLVVFGANVVRNRGDEPVTLQSGSLTDETRRLGAHVVEVRAMDPRDSDNELVGAARWPYENFRALSRPLKGYVLDPGREAALLFIVRPDVPGEWQWRTAQVRYAAGGQGYQARSSSGFMVCAPVTQKCEPKLP